MLSVFIVMSHVLTSFDDHDSVSVLRGDIKEVVKVRLPVCFVFL